LNLISLEIFKVCGINLLQIFVYPVWGTALRKRKLTARKASKAVLINRDIALMSKPWEDFRSWF
jgi:hypothetical protein